MSAPKNVYIQKLNQAHRINTEPTMNADRWAYGEIIAVNNVGQVKVRYLGKQLVDGNVKLISDGYILLATPLLDINLLYGNLRPGLKVLVHWTGGAKAVGAKAYVVGDENFLNSPVQSVPTDHTILSPAFDIFSGGMTDL